jgi:putative DNA primase/helicase
MKDNNNSKRNNGKKTLNPKFEEPIGTENLKAHIEQLGQGQLMASPRAILDEVLSKIDPIDFHGKAFPQRAELQRKIAELREEIAAQELELEGVSDKGREGRDVEELRKEQRQLETSINRMKVKQKEQIILCTENLRTIVAENRWGLCKHNDYIYLYNGSFWQPIEREPFKMFLGEAAESMGIDHLTARHYKFRDELMNQFNSTEYRSAPEPDMKSVRINLQNGTFMVAEGKGKLMPFNADDFITYQLPFNYDPTANAPQWQKYLDRVVPEKEKQLVLAEYLGYLFVRNGTCQLKLEKVLMLYGSGANGKSVFFDVVNALLGTENVSSYSLENLTEKLGYHRASIANKLVNYASEMNGNLESAIFKQLVSGEPIEARFPHGRPMILHNYAKLIFNCNELPRVVEHTDAYFRRWLIIPFDKTIAKEHQDKELGRKIIARELPGIFNWILNGLDRLMTQKGFTHCKAAEEAVKEFRREVDSVQMFFDEQGWQPSTDKVEELQPLYSEYKQFCVEDTYRAVGKGNFRKRLEVVGVQTARRSQGYVVFIARKSILD